MNLKTKFYNSANTTFLSYQNCILFISVCNINESIINYLINMYKFTAVSSKSDTSLSGYKIPVFKVGNPLW